MPLMLSARVKCRGFRVVYPFQAMVGRSLHCTLISSSFESADCWAYPRKVCIYFRTLSAIARRELMASFWEEWDCQGDKNHSLGMHAQRNSEETWERSSWQRRWGRGELNRRPWRPSQYHTRGGQVLEKRAHQNGWFSVRSWFLEKQSKINRNQLNKWVGDEVYLW